MDAVVRSPRAVNVWELVLCGYIPEDSVKDDGTVENSVRELAEQRYMSDRIQSAPVRLNVSPRPAPKKSGRLSKTSARSTPSHETCCVCLTKKKTHAFSPCFHMCVCERCSTRITTCPICRTPILARHHIYIS
jgi:hypothetical protein